MRTCGTCKYGTRSDIITCHYDPHDISHSPSWGCSKWSEKLSELKKQLLALRDISILRGVNQLSEKERLACEGKESLSDQLLELRNLAIKKDMRLMTEDEICEDINYKKIWQELKNKIQLAMDELTSLQEINSDSPHYEFTTEHTILYKVQYIMNVLEKKCE